MHCACAGALRTHTVPTPRRRSREQARARAHCTSHMPRSTTHAAGNALWLPRSPSCQVLVPPGVVVNCDWPRPLSAAVVEVLPSLSAVLRCAGLACCARAKAATCAANFGSTRAYDDWALVAADTPVRGHAPLPGAPVALMAPATLRGQTAPHAPMRQSSHGLRTHRLRSTLPSRSEGAFTTVIHQVSPGVTGDTPVSRLNAAQMTVTTPIHADVERASISIRYPWQFTTR